MFRDDTDLTAWDDGDAGPPFGLSWPIPAFIWPADRAWCRQRRRRPPLRHQRCQLRAITDVLADLRIDTDDDPTGDPPRYL